MRPLNPRQKTGLVAGAVFVAALSCWPPRALVAYEGSTTLTGLTEQAALKSKLHRRTLDRFALSLGLFEPLSLDPALLDSEHRQDLVLRLLSLDAGQGHAPWILERKSGQSVAPMGQTVLGWLSAGAALEQTPTDRVRHHFVNGKNGQGLSRPAGQTSVAAVAASVENGISTPRQLLSGGAMDGTGQSGLAWLDSPDNSLGSASFAAAYERAVTAQTPQARETALVEMLLATGAMLAVLEQTGDPAYVHNDLSTVLAGEYAAFVSERYGRAGVPEPSQTLSLPTVERFQDLLFDGKGGGLAERTSSRFLSTPNFDAKQLPSATMLVGKGGYLSTDSVRHFVRWDKTPNNAGLYPFSFRLDERCYADYAASLLPEIGRFAQAGLDFLLRGDLKLSLVGETQLHVTLLDQPLGSGVLTLFGETPTGERRLLTQLATLPSRPGLMGQIPLQAIPLSGFAKFVVLWKGKDQKGQPLLTSAQLNLRKTEAEPIPANPPEIVD